MSDPVFVSAAENEIVSLPAKRISRRGAGTHALHLAQSGFEEMQPHHQAELFYLQKQIQAQTPMVLVLTDGSRVEGVIEWYDREAIKVRGRERTLVYKSAIKYMHKHGEDAVTG